MGITDDVINLRLQLDELALDSLAVKPGEAREGLIVRALSAEQAARRLRRKDLIAITLLQRAELLLATGQLGEGLALLEEARETLGTLRQDDLLVRIYGQLAQAHGRLENWTEVSAACEAGIALVEKYRDKVSAPYLQSAYLSSRIGLYAWGVRSAYELHDLRLMLQRADLSKCRGIHRHGVGPSTLSAGQMEVEFRRVCAEIDLARAANASPQHLLPLLQQRQTLSDLLRIEHKAIRATPEIQPADWEALQAALGADQTILYYYWLDKETLIVASIDRHAIRAELRTLSSEEREELERYAKFVLAFTPQSSRDGLENVSEFTPLLLPTDARAFLRGKRRLLISPHRLLHAIPFHALPWKRGRLIERFAVSYIPNLASLQNVHRAAQERRVLAIGIRDYDVPGARLAPLADAEEEAQDVRKIYEQRSVPVDAFNGMDHVKDRLRALHADRALERFTCIHFACHGENVNSDTPMDSHLFLGNAMLDGPEIANWRLRAQLVVLSACCSAQRPISGRGMQELPGDELFGLQAAFFEAGAQHILGSLWPVDSAAARAITTAFHRHVAAEKPPEIALQDTVKEYLAQADWNQRDVYYWAPFFVSTNGRAEE